MEVELRNAFYTEVEAYCAVENIPFFTPNVSEDPPTGDDGIYIKALVLPTTPEVMTVCSGISNHIWILQVSIYTRKGVGEIRNLEQVDKIKAAFPVTHIFTTGGTRFTVITPPNPAPPIPIDGWFLTPVQFRVSTII